MIRIKRVYEPRKPTDGHRVLVDRLWPRGLTKEAARHDEWLKDIAPSTELRRWFGHEPARWPEFSRRFRKELKAPACVAHLDRLRGLARHGTVTLLYSARDEHHNNAVLIQQVLGGA
jgi:uncharacterized protein YeaO (DUF488 family)